MAATQGSGSEFELVLSRSRAQKFKYKGECDLDGKWSIFGQIFRSVHGKPPATLRRTGQLWKVIFAGEYGQDAGGPYRESWTEMFQELISSSLPLLKPCPNASSVLGNNQDSWILNPDATSQEQMQMFEFLGNLLRAEVEGND